MKPIRLCTIIPDPADEGHQKNVSSSVSLLQPDSHLAMASNYMWTPGDTIKVRMLGGTHHVQKMVKKYARVWLKYANLEMDFVDHGDADIRVSFKKGGSWSVIGTSCKLVPKDKPTMNFGWFNDKTSQKEFSRTVTHEFGHALGCIHEHQNPAGHIPWDKAAVYSYYKKTQGWDKDRVRANIFQTYSVDTTQFSSFDKKSIMLYAIPASLTKNGYSTKPNKVLSKTDKRFIAQAYPRLKGYDSSDDDDDEEEESSDDDSVPEESDGEKDPNSEKGSDSEDDRDSEKDRGSDWLEKLSSIVRGKWTGCYYYNNGTTEGRSDFHLTPSPYSGPGEMVILNGSGSDAIGSFTLYGSATTSGKISFTKAYPNWSWKYFGDYDATRGIMKGTWGDGSGTFLFTRE